MKDYRLLHCPFCGGHSPQIAGKARIIRKELVTLYYAVCMDCGCKTDEFLDYEDALRFWNTRRGNNE